MDVESGESSSITTFATAEFVNPRAFETTTGTSMFKESSPEVSGWSIGPRSSVEIAPVSLTETLMTSSPSAEPTSNWSLLDKAHVIASPLLVRFAVGTFSATESTVWPSVNWSISNVESVVSIKPFSAKSSAMALPKPSSETLSVTPSTIGGAYGLTAKFPALLSPSLSVIV